MICSKCGANMPDNVKFCGICGNILNLEGFSDKTQLLSGGDKTVLLSVSSNQTDTDKTELLTGGDETVLLSGSSNQTDTDKTELLTGNYNQGEFSNINNNSEMPEMMFGTYKILGVIGQGSGGIVYKALHTRLQKEVVIKQIKNPSGELNRNETDLLKGIKHSYIPQVLDFVEQNGEAYTIMDYISGSDIDKLIKNGRKFSSGEIIRIAKELCEAVVYLHGMNPPVIHSDIKPANVMLSESGDICLIDFNVSLVFNKNASVIGGTRGYAAPEQFGIPLSDIENKNIVKLTIGKITPVVNERSDVYSIGAFLYYMITGEVPDANYRGKSITSLSTRYPDGLLQITAKAMEINPSKRYKSASEMLVAIKNIGKLDRRYKALKTRRAVVTIAAVVAMGGFVALSGAGKRVLAEEHENKYNGYLSEISEFILQKNYDKAEDIIQIALEFEPNGIEPFYNQTKVYYAKKDWEKCADYPDSVVDFQIIDNENNAQYAAEMYEMAAESDFELERYEKAIEKFNKALSYSEKVINCYRDLTISYARLGDIDNAEKSLNKAETLGISNDVLELMKGEISAAKGESISAYESFLKAIELTEDDYIKFRAILVCDKTMLADNSKENAEKMISLLKKQIGDISDEYVGTVKEMLANEYFIAEDYENAAETYDELFLNGELNYSLQKNYYNILFSKLHGYEKCVEMLKKMKQESPEDYWVEMNFAYVYISIENAKAQTARDYSSAYESYKKAEELYSAYVKNGRSDPNMDSLRAAVNELKNYGWIKEN